MTLSDTSGTATGQALQITHVGTVGIPVSDQDKALGFYAGTLGFEVRRDLPFGAGDRWLEVAPLGAAARVALLPHGDHTVTGVDTRIRLFSADVDADHAALVAAGADVDADVMHFGGPVPPMCFCWDPGGNTDFNTLVIVGDTASPDA